MHPYRQKLEDSLYEQKELLSLLEEKSKLINSAISNSQELNWNNMSVMLKLDTIDFKISLIENNNRIKSVKNAIKIKQDYFDRFITQIEKDIAEVEQHYDDYLSKVIELSLKDSNVKLFLSKNDFNKIAENIELKIKVFKEFKKILGKQQST